MNNAASFTVGASLLALTFPAAALDLTAGSGAASGCPTSGRSLAVSMGAVGWLEPAPVTSYDEYGGRHYSPSEGANRGVGIGFAEIAAATHGFCLGIVYREEYHGRASKDLLDLIRGGHHDDLFDPARTYELALDYEAFSATGLRLRKTFEIAFDESTLKIGTGASLLKGRDGERHRGLGSITASSSDWATGTAYWDRIKSDLGADDFNPYVERGHPSGWGYSTDLELSWTTRSGWEANLVVMDLYGQLHWRDLPRTLKRLDNAQISYNENLDESATIVGFDSVVDLDQRIPTKYHLALTTRPFKGWSAIVSDDVVDDLHFPSVGVRHRLRDHSIDLAYDLRTEGLTLTFAASAFRIALSAQTAFDRSTVFGLVAHSMHAW